MKTLQQLGTDLGELLEEKNAAYGSSFSKAGDFLRLLWPGGVPADRYDDALLLVRIFDKQMRIATDKDAFGESPYQDIAGYGICGVQLHQQRKDSTTWPDTASADAATQSKAQPVSAAQPTSAKTTTSASATTANGPSPRPGSCSAALETVAVPTATELANASEDALRLLKNEQLLCAFSGCDRGFVSWPRSYCTNIRNMFYRYCSYEHAASDIDGHREKTQ